MGVKGITVTALCAPPFGHLIAGVHHFGHHGVQLIFLMVASFLTLLDTLDTLFYKILKYIIYSI